MKHYDNYYVYGVYRNGDKDYISNYTFLEDARFNAKYQARFYDTVCIKHKDEVILKYHNINGRIEEEICDGK